MFRAARRVLAAAADAAAAPAARPPKAWTEEEVIKQIFKSSGKLGQSSVSKFTSVEELLKCDTFALKEKGVPPKVRKAVLAKMHSMRTRLAVANEKGIPINPRPLPSAAAEGAAAPAEGASA
eukprot:tig00020515_g9771.t1